MEIAYLMVGKRIRATDVADLNRQLAVYKLVSNLSDARLEHFSVRRISDLRDTRRYDLTQSVGDSADILGYDLIVGKSIHPDKDVVETELSDLESALNEVREDIPDAKIIAGSYWS